MLESDVEQWTGSKLGKEYVKAVYCHPAYLYAEYIMQNAGPDEAQVGIKVSGLTFKSLIHYEFIFIYGVRKWSSSKSKRLKAIKERR